MPKVSVIIPSYNNATELEELLQSIWEQSFSDYEVLIIDGNSNDHTDEVVKKHASKIAIYISEKDDGIFDAMNKGILKASGEWLIFMGCDDKFYNPEVLENIFTNPLNGADVIYGKIFNKSNKIERGEEILSKGELLDGKQFWHQAIFYKRIVFEQVGLYKVEYKIAADTLLNLEAYCLHNLRFKFKNVIVSSFGGDGISASNFDRLFHKNQYKIYFKLFQGLPKKRIYKALQHHLYNEIKSGNIVIALLYYLRICWFTQSLRPQSKNALHYLQLRIQNGKLN